MIRRPWQVRYTRQSEKDLGRLDSPIRRRIVAGVDIDANEIERLSWHVIDLHPAQLTLDELVRELTDTPEHFGSRDRIAVAVRQLARTGLLHRHGKFVLPTRAVLRTIELDVG